MRASSFVLLASTVFSFLEAQHLSNLDGPKRGTYKTIKSPRRSLRAPMAALTISDVVGCVAGTFLRGAFAGFAGAAASSPMFVSCLLAQSIFLLIFAARRLMTDLRRCRAPRLL